MRSFRDSFPPDTVRWREILGYVLTGLFFVVGFGLLFGMLGYVNSEGAMYEELSYGRRLLPGARMPEFGDMIESVMVMYWFYVVCALARVVDHYVQFYRGTRSIYVMKRLPDSRREMFARCWTAPLIAIVIGAVAAVVVLFIIFRVYRYATPEGCLPDEVRFEFWRAFMYRI